MNAALPFSRASRIAASCCLSMSCSSRFGRCWSPPAGCLLGREVRAAAVDHVVHACRAVLPGAEAAVHAPVVGVPPALRALPRRTRRDGHDAFLSGWDSWHGSPHRRCTTDGSGSRSAVDAGHAEALLVEAAVDRAVHVAALGGEVEGDGVADLAGVAVAVGDLGGERVREVGHGMSSQSVVRMWCAPRAGFEPAPFTAGCRGWDGQSSLVTTKPSARE